MRFLTVPRFEDVEVKETTARETDRQTDSQPAVQTYKQTDYTPPKTDV